MKKVLRNFLEFLSSEDGPTAVEYAVMLAFIIIVCFIAITSLGTKTAEAFDKAANGLGG